MAKAKSAALSADVEALLRDLKTFGAFSEEGYDAIWGAAEVREDGCISHEDAHEVFRLSGMTRKQASALICAVRDEQGEIFIETIAALAGKATSAARVQHDYRPVYGSDNDNGNGNASRTVRTDNSSKSKAQLRKRARRRQRRQQREEGWLDTHTFSARFGTTHDQNTRFLERKRKLCARRRARQVSEARCRAKLQAQRDKHSVILQKQRELLRTRQQLPTLSPSSRVPQFPTPVAETEVDFNADADAEAGIFADNDSVHSQDIGHEDNVELGMSLEQYVHKTDSSEGLFANSVGSASMSESNEGDSATAYPAGSVATMLADARRFTAEHTRSATKRRPVALHVLKQQRLHLTAFYGAKSFRTLAGPARAIAQAIDAAYSAAAMAWRVVDAAYDVIRPVLEAQTQDAATILQQQWRAKIAYAEVHDKRQQRDASLKLQKFWRAKEARMRVDKMREERCRTNTHPVHREQGAQSRGQRPLNDLTGTQMPGEPFSQGEFSEAAQEFESAQSIIGDEAAARAAEAAAPAEMRSEARDRAGQRDASLELQNTARAKSARNTLQTKRDEESKQHWAWTLIGGRVETNRVFAEPAKGGGSYCHCWFVSHCASVPVIDADTKTERCNTAGSTSQTEDEWAKKADAVFHAHEDIHMHGAAHDDVVDPSNVEEELGVVWGAMLQKRFPAAEGQYLYVARTIEHEEVTIGPLSVTDWSQILVDAPSAAEQTALPGTKPGESGFYLSKRLILAQYHVDTAGQWVRSERPAPVLSHIPALLRDMLVAARGSL